MKFVEILSLSAKKLFIAGKAAAENARARVILINVI